MAKPIYEDPVVAKIQAIRQSLLDECGGDINEYRRRALERQNASDRRVISTPFRIRTERSDAVQKAGDNAFSKGNSSTAAG